MATLLLGVAVAIQARATAKSIHLLGWWDNPTPGNAWLDTATTQYVIAEQGSPGADGDWPQFNARQQVNTNGPHGYGCAELEAIVRGDRVLHILHAKALPLASCRTSPALRKAEPSH